MPVLLLHTDNKLDEEPRPDHAGFLGDPGESVPREPQARAERRQYPGAVRHQKLAHSFCLLGSARDVLLGAHSLRPLRVQLQIQEAGIHLHHADPGDAYSGIRPRIRKADGRLAPPEYALASVPPVDRGSGSLLLHVQLHAVEPPDGAR